MANKHTLAELKQWQALPLSIKIRMTETRIRGWVHEYGEDGVYVSFSGGKDSTVLLDIVRNRCGYKNIPAVFVDVPTQYPELRDFVKTFDNVEILKPKISFMEVCEKYGFPLISKETSESVQAARKYLTTVKANNADLTDRQADRQIGGYWAVADLMGIPRRQGAQASQEYQDLKKGIIPDYAKWKHGMPAKASMIFGMYPHKENGIETGEYSQIYDKQRWKFMLDAPFEVSNMCCNVMKKTPAHTYARRTGRKPMTAQMAAESRLRTSHWIKDGCNGFHLKEPTSNPMAFWVENDVLQYIVENNLPICSVYGEVVEDFGSQIDGQMDLQDMGWGDCRKQYKTTGCERTGCMLCGFGCHIEKSPNRFEMLKETHPGMYGMLDRVTNNGVTMRQAIEWMNEHGGLNIKL